jgi:predicted nucleotidyltransferase
LEKPPHLSDRLDGAMGASGTNMREVLKAKRAEILRIAARHGARNVRLFGSVARGEADAKSDVDVLVDMEPGRSLLDMGGLLMDLQDLLGCRVDVVSERGLRERIRERVLQEAIPL